MAAVAYLDHAASTPMHPEVVEAMGEFYDGCYANPTGAHRMAREARRAGDDARDVLAEALGARPGEIVFCGSGTEADNLAVFGAGSGGPGGTVVCSATEHPAVLRPTEQLGGRVVGVDHEGALDLDALADALDGDVRLVSVMLANNETGVICSLTEVAEVIARHAPGALLHTDAVQAFPWLDVAALAAPADLISISAHKFGGPKGVGALVVRDGVALQAQLVGGGQESERRSGTPNVSGIVGMGVAAGLTVARRADVVARAGRLRDRLADGLRASVEGVTESGVRPTTGAATPVDRSAKVAGSCHLCFEGIESEALLFLAERGGVYASAASACASGAEHPSHVLEAMGYPRDLARGSLRLSLGVASTEADVDTALAVLPAAVAQLRRAAA
ncbi:MAG: cysteine desulfurase family protein [bacterium]|nr:cysteine desulfurase family protein [bacterium]MCY3951618.1 cysteine desulfurase family protein [bacterium]